jgi:ATP-binding cassette subfamily G (WHITE) protein 2 (PDR)
MYNTMEYHRKIQLGVNFRDLNVYGSSSSIPHQQTVASYILEIPKGLPGLFISHQKGRPLILQDFTGSVRSGDMSPVLGRPGSGCLCFRKSLAGETSRLEIDNEFYINYEGRSFSNHHRLNS